MPVRKIAAALPCDQVSSLQRRAETVMEQLKQDYFAEKSDAAFRAKHLGHTSLVAKLAAYRFFDTETFNVLKECAQKPAVEIYGADSLVLHPIFYLRFSYPGSHQSDLQRRAFLDSQPHFDRSFGLHAYSFWLALDDIDADSGGLASFSGPASQKEFATDGRNRYDYETYLKCSATLDPILKKEIATYRASAGDLLTFDSTVLHGATKATCRRRLSLDFRLVDIEQVQAAPKEVQRIFLAFNENVTLSNARNLIFLGDRVGAQRLSNAASSLACPPGRTRRILEPGMQMRWQDEYAYLRQSAEG